MSKSGMCKIIGSIKDGEQYFTAQKYIDGKWVDLHEPSLALSSANMHIEFDHYDAIRGSQFVSDMYDSMVEDYIKQGGECVVKGDNDE